MLPAIWSTAVLCYVTFEVTFAYETMSLILVRPLQVCADLISTIRGNVETGRAMKVRWNACYAASNCLKPLALFRDKRTSDERAKLIKALLPLVEDFPNFKVRT